MAELKEKSATIELTRAERKSLKKELRQELVKRSALVKIAAAWVITVPAAGLMSALLFFAIKGVMVSDSAGDQESGMPKVETTE